MMAELFPLLLLLRVSLLNERLRFLKTLDAVSVVFSLL
jgi:hypothetical protein